MFPFAVGATAAPVRRAADARERSRAAIARYRPTVVTNVPTMMGKLLEHDDERARRAASRGSISRACASTSRPARRCRRPLLERFIERFGGEVYDGIGSAEMFHIYCIEPARRRQARLARPRGRGLRRSRSCPRTPTGPARAELPPRRDRRAVGARATGRARATSRIATRAGRPSTATGAAPAICSASTSDGYLWFSGRADDLLKVGGVLGRAARGRGVPAAPPRGRARRGDRRRGGRA